MYKLLGYLNIALLVLVTAPYWVRRLNQWVFHSTSAGYQKLMKLLRALHKPAALVLLISIFAHGWLALGGFQLHTGTVAAISFGLTALVGLLFYLMRKAPLLKAHRILALVSVLLVVLHLLFPWLLSSL